MTEPSTDRRGAGGPTAVIVVEVFPAGVPGHVLLQTRSVGPVDLTGPEMIRTLRSAADSLEADEAARDADS